MKLSGRRNCLEGIKRDESPENFRWFGYSHSTIAPICSFALHLSLTMLTVPSLYWYLQYSSRWARKNPSIFGDMCFSNVALCRVAVYLSGSGGVAFWLAWFSPCGLWLPYNATIAPRHSLWLQFLAIYFGFYLFRHSSVGHFILWPIGSHPEATRSARYREPRMHVTISSISTLYLTSHSTRSICLLSSISILTALYTDVRALRSASLAPPDCHERNIRRYLHTCCQYCEFQQCGHERITYITI